MYDGRTQLRATVLASVLLLGLFTSFVNPVAPVAEEAEAALNPVPVLQLALSPNALEAHVTNSQNGPVSFSGNATVEKLSGSLERVTVTLSATCVWTAIVTPSTMIFSVPGTQQFWVTVIVPPKTSSLEVGQVIVSGTARAPGMPVAVAQANGVVTVDQFYKVSLGSDSPLREVQPADLTFGVINIYNEGNGIDSFEIEVENSKELQDKEWNIIIERTSVDVSAEEFKQIKVTIQTPQKWTIWTKKIQLVTIKVVSAEARNANILYSQKYSVSIFVKGIHIPGFDLTFAVMALAFVGVMVKQREMARKSGKRLIRHR
jgi:hypothetical protein